MSQNGGFGGGFLLGAIFGGLVGGLLGATLAQRQGSSTPQDLPEAETAGDRPLRSRFWRERASEAELSADERIELARRSLESKIAQLNEAIDDVREQLNEPLAEGGLGEGVLGDGVAGNGGTKGAIGN